MYQIKIHSRIPFSLRDIEILCNIPSNIIPFVM
jgi:hypothetical protein